jgi:hypothetical protein
LTLAAACILSCGLLGEEEAAPPFLTDGDHLEVHPACLALSGGSPDAGTTAQSVVLVGTRANGRGAESVRVTISVEPCPGDSSEVTTICGDATRAPANSWSAIELFADGTTCKGIVSTAVQCLLGSDGVATFGVRAVGSAVGGYIPVCMGAAARDAGATTSDAATAFSRTLPVFVVDRPASDAGTKDAP